MKRIHIEKQGDKAAKVYRDSDYQEFRVRLYINGELHAAADYFTDDKADAIESAFAMVRPNPRKAAKAESKPLSVRFNVAVNHIANKVLPRGFDVAADAPQDFESLIAHYKKTGRVLVWNGGSDSTIFACPDANYSFRAWHDSKHITRRLPFTRQGELCAMELQKEDVRRIYDGGTADYFCTLIDAEIRGQFDYKEKHGGFPLDQSAFTRAYLEDAAQAVAYPAYGISKAAA